MNQLANAFSLLKLDVGDDREQTATIDHVEIVNGRGKGKKKKDTSGDVSLPKKENGPIVEVKSEAYKLPLVWIDLEMTGLDVNVDRILEIACIITNGNLTKLVEGPHLIIHQSMDCMEKMGEWCQTQHAASGLTDKVLQSTVSEQEAEKQVADFVKRYTGSYTPLLAGNSIYMDYMFLKMCFTGRLVLHWEGVLKGKLQHWKRTNFSISTCPIWLVFSRMCWLMLALSKLSAFVGTQKKAKRLLQRKKSIEHWTISRRALLNLSQGEDIQITQV